MTNRAPLSFILLLAFAGWPAAADLQKVMAERNLEKRADKASLNAGQALDGARKAHQNGEAAKMKAALAELWDSVALAKKSLDDSGKSARGSPKYFKRVEINLGALLRRLETFRLEMSFDDRAPVEELEKKVHLVREEILLSIMSRR